MTKPSPEAIALFQPVLDWLEAGAPHTADDIGFNMDYFQRRWHVQGPDFAGNNCGTSCCIAGAVTQFNRLDADWIESEDCDPGEVSVQGLLGLTDEDSRSLFYGDGNFHLAKIRPEDAAKTLRHYIETGEVVWDVPYAAKP